MKRKIKTSNFECTCGSKLFYFQSFGSDGVAENWVDASCQSCGTQYEIWDSTVEYDFYMSDEDMREVTANILEGTRASFALEGIKISDSVFEQLQEFLDNNPDFTV